MKSKGYDENDILGQIDYDLIPPQAKRHPLRKAIFLATSLMVGAGVLYFGSDVYQALLQQNSPGNSQAKLAQASVTGAEREHAPAVPSVLPGVTSTQPETAATGTQRPEVPQAQPQATWGAELPHSVRQIANPASAQELPVANPPGTPVQTAEARPPAHASEAPNPAAPVATPPAVISTVVPPPVQPPVAKAEEPKPAPRPVPGVDNARVETSRVGKGAVDTGKGFPSSTPAISEPNPIKQDPKRPAPSIATAKPVIPPSPPAIPATPKEPKLEGYDYTGIALSTREPRLVMPAGLRELPREILAMYAKTSAKAWRRWVENLKVTGRIEKLREVPSSIREVFEQQRVAYMAKYVAMTCLENPKHIECANTTRARLLELSDQAADYLGQDARPLETVLAKMGIDYSEPAIKQQEKNTSSHAKKSNRSDVLKTSEPDSHSGSSDVSRNRQEETDEGSYAQDFQRNERGYEKRQGSYPAPRIESWPRDGEYVPAARVVEEQSITAPAECDCQNSGGYRNPGLICRPVPPVAAPPLNYPVPVGASSRPVRPLGRGGAPVPSRLPTTSY